MTERYGAIEAEIMESQIDVHETCIVPSTIH